MVLFNLFCILPVSHIVITIYNINGALHVFEQINSKTENQHLFCFSALAEPYLLIGVKCNLSITEVIGA
jgi:hypothetical protein